MDPAQSVTSHALDKLQNAQPEKKHELDPVNEKIKMLSRQVTKEIEVSRLKKMVSEVISKAIWINRMDGIDALIPPLLYPSEFN